MNQSIVTEVLRAKLAEQPIVKRYANTVTTAVGVVVALVWTLISIGIDVPSDVAKWVLVGISLVTMIGVKFTPNGVTDKQINEIEEYAARNVPRGE
ncbi:hypothetical protein GS676_02905 [Rhodococcus hoagii]|nr:hypothetical protein [Prescottella equi]MBM4558196.1 hypothetical protein [Prescottella equi]NKT41816.1 hypothetical protein [Prescottella equi]